MSTAKANRTVSTKAGSPIESDVGNYEQMVVKWRDFLQRKQGILKGVGKRLPITTTVGWTPVNNGLSRVVVGSKPQRGGWRGFSDASKLRNFEFAPCSRSDIFHKNRKLTPSTLLDMCSRISRSTPIMLCLLQQFSEVAHPRIRLSASHITG